MTTVAAGALGRAHSAWSSGSAAGTAMALAPAVRRRVGRALATLTSGSDPALRSSNGLVIPSLLVDAQLMVVPTLSASGAVDGVRWWQFDGRGPGSARHHPLMAFKIPAISR